MSKVIGYKTQVTVILVSTCLITCIAIGIIVYLYLKFSGIPYINHEMKLQLQKMAVVFAVWTSAELLKNIPALFIESTPGNISKSDFVNAILTALMVVVLEVIPFLLALESSFIDMFKVSFGDKITDETPFIMSPRTGERGLTISEHDQDRKLSTKAYTEKGINDRKITIQSKSEQSNNG